MSGQPQGRPASADDRPTAPLEVYYVVQTTAGVIGKRQHRMPPSLFDMRNQAQIELLYLQEACPGSGTYGIWKSTTYAELAE